MTAITTPLSPGIQPATPLHSHPPPPAPPPSSDPRVSAIDNFTRTTHSTPNRTLRASLSFPSSSPSSTTSSASSFTVAILGASRGIGAGIALSYARAGATSLILAARNTTQLAAVAAQVRDVNPSCAVHVRACDVASPTSVRALARFVGDEELGGGGDGAETGGNKKALDVLVLNAGYAGHVELEVTDGDAEKDGQWAQAFAVNALGTYHAAHYFVPLLLRGGAQGAFCVVGSIAGCIRRGIIANSKYCISKMAQVRIVEHVAEQFGGKGLLAVAVHPGAVETTMAMESTPEEFKKCEFFCCPPLFIYGFLSEEWILTVWQISWTIRSCVAIFSSG